ncbi:hypothetical protein HDU78_008697 [Chytriomyces hyalinus]|nr:hypothetical protein HDU78_008697 [Chytriomyces hyalinus]
MKNAAIALFLCLALNVLGLQLSQQQPLFQVQDESRPYDGHKVLRVKAHGKARHQIANTLANVAGVVSVLAVGSNHVDIHVDSFFASFLPSHVVVDNVQHVVDAEMERLEAAQHSFSKMSDDEKYAPENWFSDYHRYDDIVAWYKQLADKHPDLVTFIPSIGKSALNKDIIAIKVSSNVNKDTKSQFWYHTGDHAREWVGPSTVQYFVHSVLQDHATNPALLDNAELIIVPLMNVDGYEYSWAGNRLWRKNRRVVKRDFFGSVGVDLNRNWPAHWGEGGSSNQPFSDVYMGPAAGSEPEVKALINFFMNDNHTRLIGAIDLHAFSQLVLRPYGWTEDPAPDEKLLKKAGDDIRDTIKKVSGKKYVSEREIDLYAASGTASDWFYDDDVQEWLPDRRLYAYTIELRPSADEANGAQGFILPPAQIIPTGQEIYEALKGYMAFALKNPLLVKK